MGVADAFQIEKRAERLALRLGEIAVMALASEAVLAGMIQADGGSHRDVETLRKAGHGHHAGAVGQGQHSLADAVAFVAEDEGCFLREIECVDGHGAVVEVNDDGTLKPTGWPNSGMGRLNPDGGRLAQQNLVRFTRLARAMGIQRIDFLATAAVREAADGPEFAPGTRRSTRRRP